MIHGNTSGLRSSQLRALERLTRRRVPPERLVTPELAREMTELSRELRRQIGVVLDRPGAVLHVVVGNDREIVLPDLTDHALGRSGLRGLRCVHTHLKGEPLSQDDLNDLALLRLDLMAVLAVDAAGLPGPLHYAHLLPAGPDGRVVESVRVASVHALDLDFTEFVAALEAELERTRAATVDLSDRREKAILISVTQAPRQEADDSLDELAELARTADLLVIDRVMQRPRQLNPRTLMGEGKLKEVVIRALQQGATLLVFDQDLTPAQVRAITTLTEVNVIDRSQLILDIFARRAHTLDGKVQVELAQLR
jgi:GTP-binding protein HflX